MAWMVLRYRWAGRDGVDGRKGDSPRTETERMVDVLHLLDPAARHKSTRPSERRDDSPPPLLITVSLVHTASHFPKHIALLTRYQPRQPRAIHHRALPSSYRQPHRLNHRRVAFAHRPFPADCGVLPCQRMTRIASEGLKGGLRRRRLKIIAAVVKKDLGGCEVF